MGPAEAFAMVMTTGMVFGWIPVLIYVKHKYRLEELRARMGGMTQDSLAELRALRQEVERLRDTTTKFDVAFDSALTRLEERVDSVEGNPVRVAEPESQPTRTYAAEPAPQTVSVGRRQWM